LITIVKGIESQITASNTKKSSATGDDADIEVAEAEAAIKWYNDKKAEIVIERDNVSDEYAEKKLTREVLDKQNKDEIAL